MIFSKDFETYEKNLYKAKYIDDTHLHADDLWLAIKNSRDILKWATTKTRDKFDERDTVNGTCICDAMLSDYTDVNPDYYEGLVNLIYSNIDIARIVVNGPNNGGCSFLLMSLMNHGLKLNEEQKSFAVSEALNKIGTTLWLHKEQEYISKYEEEKTPNEKAFLQFRIQLLSQLDGTQAHGMGAFDIRYQILSNPNWTDEEKKKLVYDFYASEDDYEEKIEQWEWGVVNSPSNFMGEPVSQMDYDHLYDYTYRELENLCGDPLEAARLKREIEFCKKMHILRPTAWDKEKEDANGINRNNK